jgi:hypothetical protein
VGRPHEPWLWVPSFNLNLPFHIRLSCIHSSMDRSILSYHCIIATHLYGSTATSPQIIPYSLIILMYYRYLYLHLHLRFVFFIAYCSGLLPVGTTTPEPSNSLYLRTRLRSIGSILGRHVQQKRPVNARMWGSVNKDLDALCRRGLSSEEVTRDAL